MFWYPKAVVRHFSAPRIRREAPPCRTAQRISFCPVNWNGLPCKWLFGIGLSVPWEEGHCRIERLGYLLRGIGGGPGVFDIPVAFSIWAQSPLSSHMSSISSQSGFLSNINEGPVQVCL